MRIGVIGLGYVGLPLAVAFGKDGHAVVGVDTDQRKVSALSRGESYIEDVPDEDVAGLGDALRPTSRYADLASCEAVVIAVPTPLTRNREPDLGPLIGAGTSLAGVLQQGQLVVLESTT
jgi:UDP-N-acetyl-D-glucosamine dehydrogenase